MPAHFDACHGALWSSLFNPQAHASVVDQQLTVRLEDREHFPMRETQVRGVTWPLSEVEPHCCTRCEVDTATGYGANAQPRSLQIGEDPNGPLDGVFDTADRLHIGGKRGVVGMTHIDAEDVYTRFAQAADHVWRLRSRTQSRDDFHTAAAAHAFPITRLVGRG